MAQLRTFLALAPFLLAGPIAISVLGGFSASGCEAYHNEAERLAYKKALDAEEARLYPPTGVAGAGGMASTYTYIGAGYNPPDPTQCPNGQCRPDPGSRVVSADECKAAEEGLEFLPLPIWDFEDDRDYGYNDKDKDRLWDRSDMPDFDGDGRTDEGKVTDTITERMALHGYTYSDDTTYNYYPFGWEPPAIPDPYGRCERKDNHVFHIAGGPFIEWGGGLGRSLRCMNTATNWANNVVQTTINEWRTAKGYQDPKAPTDLQENGIGAIYCHTGQNTGASIKITAACDRAEDGSQLPGICPQRDRNYKATKTIEPPQDKALLGMAIDVSAWEGISFWARRGPNSQAGFRVLVGDKYTDDDISFAQYMLDPTLPRYCERMFECKCKNASRPCTAITEEERNAINGSLNAAHSDLDKYAGDLKNPSPDYYANLNSYNLNPLKPGEKICWDRSVPNAIAIATRTQYCGQTSCIHQSDSGKSLNVSHDPFIDDTTCQEYTFRGSIQTDVCYNPDSQIAGQQTAAEQSRVCGDHWMRSIDLTQDWAFYTVPFNTLLQQGWAKRTYLLDLTALTLARITWDRGYIDFYIDDVRFYRKKK